MNRKFHAWLAVMALVSATGALAQSLTVSAAASLADALREVGARFEAARPGVSLRFNIAASGVLLQQIQQGAPVDVLASADEETVERGIAQQRLDAATRRVFAANELVLVAPVGSTLPRQLADLTRPEVRRVAIGKALTVPAGRYAREGLEAAGLWEAVQSRLIGAESVRQVLDYVARAEVEAGFVYRTDAQVARERVRVVAAVAVPRPIRYPAVRVADSRQGALAMDFIDYLGGPTAQAILARHGFLAL